MSRRTPKQDLFAQFALVAKTLGHAHRLELLEHIAQGERSVDALARLTALSVANASQHLQRMRRAGLVTAGREGKFVYYRLADEAVLDLLGGLRKVAERNVAEVQRVVRGYFDQRDSMEAVSRDELRKRIRAGDVTVIDVRPPDEFALGHVAGAINIPLRDLIGRLSELDKSHEIVAYCRGAYCVLSFEAVAALRQKGYRARRLQDGLPEWRAAGLPVTVRESQVRP
jgi:ArsR family transcriptional regulator